MRKINQKLQNKQINSTVSLARMDCIIKLKIPTQNDPKYQNGEITAAYSAISTLYENKPHKFQIIPINQTTAKIPTAVLTMHVLSAKDINECDKLDQIS